MEIWSEGSTLHLSGDFDVRHTAQVRRALHEMTSAGAERVVIDVSGITSVDLTALRVVARACQLAARSGQSLVLVGCSPQVVRMLHLTRLARVVRVAKGATVTATAVRQ